MPRFLKQVAVFFGLFFTLNIWADLPPTAAPTVPANNVLNSTPPVSTVVTTPGSAPSLGTLNTPTGTTNTNAISFAQQAGAIAGAALGCGQDIGVFQSRVNEALFRLSLSDVDRTIAMANFQRAMQQAQAMQLTSHPVVCTQVTQDFNSLPLMRDDYQQTVLPSLSPTMGVPNPQPGTGSANQSPQQLAAMGAQLPPSAETVPVGSNPPAVLPASPIPVPSGNAGAPLPPSSAPIPSGTGPMPTHPVATIPPAVEPVTPTTVVAPTQSVSSPYSDPHSIPTQASPYAPSQYNNSAGAPLPQSEPVQVPPNPYMPPTQINPINEPTQQEMVEGNHLH